MKRELGLVMAAALGLCLSASCGAGEPEAGGSDGSAEVEERVEFPAPLEAQSSELEILVKLEENYGIARCRAYYRCERTREYFGDLPYRSSSLANCEEAVRLQSVGRRMRLLQRLEAGRVAVPRQWAVQCYEALRGQIIEDICQVDDSWAQTQDCADLEDGLQGFGEACSSFEDCAGRGYRCSSEGQGCLGTCISDGAPSCGGTHCEDDEYCEAGRCVAAGRSGDSCSRSQECGAGADCVAQQETSLGFCADRGSGRQGSACSFDETCAPGFACLDQECRPLEEPSIVGEGQPCSYRSAHGDIDAVCQAGLRCVEDLEGESYCRRPLGAGDPCEDTWDCALGLECRGDSDEEPGRCVAPREDRAPCQYDSDCASGWCGALGCSSGELCY